MNQQKYWAETLKLFNAQIRPHNITIKEWYREGKYNEILLYQLQDGQT